MTEAINPVVYFLRYASPCSHILCSVRSEVSKEEFDKIEQGAIKGEPLDKAYLEKVFFRAFNRISKIAEELGKDKWDLEVIKEYFTVRHNPVLDATDYPNSFKEQCKVFVGTVKELLENNEAIVEYENKTTKKRRVKTLYVPDIKPGEKVRIHWSYIAERV